MGKFANPSILIAAGLIFGLLVAGAWPRQTPMADGGPSSAFLYAVWQWQPLIGSAFVLVAAIVAWIGVQRQIRGDDRRATRIETEARTVAIESAEPILTEVGAYWRAITLAVDRYPDGDAIALAGFFSLEPANDQIDRLNGNVEGLAPSAHDRWNAIIIHLRFVASQRERMFRDGRTPAREELMAVEVALTRLADLCGQFDPRLADPFDDERMRHRAVGEAGAANPSHAFIDDWENDHPAPANEGPAPATNGRE